MLGFIVKKKIIKARNLHKPIGVNKKDTITALSDLVKYKAGIEGDDGKLVGSIGQQKTHLM